MTRVTEEVKDLFKKVRTLLGAPIRTVELTDEMLCELLDTVVGDYAERVHSFLIETQWMSLYGKNISRTDFAFALSTRTFDMAKDYSYWFSKNVGLQQEGPWELKKDFIEKLKNEFVLDTNGNPRSVYVGKNNSIIDFINDPDNKKLLAKITNDPVMDYMDNNIVAAVQCYNMGYGSMMKILRTYSAITGKSIEDILQDENDYFKIETLK